MCDRDGRFLAVNDALADLLGYRPDDMVGRPFLTFVHPQERAASLSAYFTSVVAAAGQQRRRAEQAELRCLTADGRVLWLAVSWTITALDLGGAQFGIVHLSDVTGRRAVHRQLVKAQHRFELAFNCAPIGVALVARDGRFIQVNPALEALLGYRQTELVDHSFASVIDPADRATSLAVFEQLLAGEIEVHQSIRRFRHRRGRTLRTRRVVVAAREPDGQVDQLLLLIEPIGREPAGAGFADPQLRDPATGLATVRQLGLHLDLTAGMSRTLVLAQIQDPRAGSAGPGADEADRLTTQVARRLLDCCREGDLIAHIADREFAVLVDDDHARAGRAIASRIRAVLTDPFTIDQASTPLHVRVGLATDVTGTSPLGALLREARTAAQKPAQSAAATPPARSRSLVTGIARELALGADLVSALHERQLALVYQPIIALGDATVASIEALSRWQHPTLGPIRPDEFIPIAERGAAIHTLTEWALLQACADLAHWHTNYPSAGQLSVAVNISALSFTLPDFPGIVEQCLNQAGLRAEHLTLEITETAAAEHGTRFIANATTLRRLGVRIALDDFGAGHSSLARIAKLPITDLKLDRAITDPNNDPNVIGALLRGMVGIAHDLDLRLVAEGIETQSQLELLRRCQCRYAQGNLLAPPQTRQQISDRLAAR